MEYRNTITGAVISVACEIHGDNWEPLQAPSKPVKTEETKSKGKKAAK